MDRQNEETLLLLGIGPEPTVFPGKTHDEVIWMRHHKPSMRVYRNEREKRRELCKVLQYPCDQPCRCGPQAWRLKSGSD